MAARRLPPVRDVLRSAAIWSGVAGVVCVAVPPMILGYPLVLVDRDRAISDWYFRQIGKALVRMNPMWKVVVEGKDKLARGGPFVLVCNHQSLADLIGMCFLDHPTKYIGKASAFKVPLFGWALRIAGEVPVVRGDKASGHDALHRLGGWLDRGVSVAVFPEGTRSATGAIGPFKLGAFRLAINHQRPVVPIVLGGAREVLPKRSLLFERHAVIRLRVLDPVATVGLGEHDTERLAADIRARMVEAHRELEPELEPGLAPDAR